MGEQLPYRTTCWWGDLGLGDGPAEPQVRYFPTLYDAETDGQSMGCLAGIRRVEVHSLEEDGSWSLQALWDKESKERRKAANPWWVDEDTGEEYYDYTSVSSLWQRVGTEAKELAARERQLLNEAMRRGLSTQEAAAFMRKARFGEA